jgi:hypothetical protein
MRKMSRPTVMRVVICLALGVLGAQALAGCASPGQKTHKMYTYTRFANPGKTEWHPGERIAVTWQPAPGADTTDATPATVVISMRLFGPYPSADKANAAAKSPTQLAQTAVSLSMPPQQTDSWSGATLSGALDLPKTLAAGYYALQQTVVAQTANARDTASAALILHITP